MKTSVDGKLVLQWCLLSILLCFIIMFAFRTANAYSGSSASSYAQQYANSYNSLYKILDKDCTNFVSQSVAAGGISRNLNPTIPTTAGTLQDYRVDNNNTYWYHIRYTNAFGYNNWTYTKTWSFVNDFRNYMGNPSIGTVSVAPASDADSLIYSAPVGSVLQYSNNATGAAHSVIVSKPGYYCSHTNNRLNQPLSTFELAASASGGYVYLIKFK